MPAGDIFCFLPRSSFSARGWGTDTSCQNPKTTQPGRRRGSERGGRSRTHKSPRNGQRSRRRRRTPTRGKRSVPAGPSYYWLCNQWPCTSNISSLQMRFPGRRTLFFPSLFCSLLAMLHCGYHHFVRCNMPCQRVFFHLHRTASAIHRCLIL